MEYIQCGEQKIVRGRPLHHMCHIQYIETCMSYNKPTEKCHNTKIDANKKVNVFHRNISYIDMINMELWDPNISDKIILKRMRIYTVQFPLKLHVHTRTIVRHQMV